MNESHDLPDDTNVCAHKWTTPDGVLHECRIAPGHDESKNSYHACSCGQKGEVDGP